MVHKVSKHSSLEHTLASIYLKSDVWQFHLLLNLKAHIPADGHLASSCDKAINIIIIFLKGKTQCFSKLSFQIFKQTN